MMTRKVDRWARLPNIRGFCPHVVFKRTLNKVSAGMSFNSYRSNKGESRPHKETTTALMLYGTTDKLAGGLRKGAKWRFIEHPTCTCCGSPMRHKIKLSDEGKAYLKRKKESKNVK